MGAHAAEAAGLFVERTDMSLRVTAGGAWTAGTVAGRDAELRELSAGGGKDLVIDLSRVERMDTAGAWMFTRLAHEWRSAGGQCRIEGAQGGRQRLLAAIAEPSGAVDAAPAGEPWALRILALAGRFALAIRRDTILSFNMIGAAIAGAQLRERRVGGLRLIPIAHHIDRMAFRALPIVSLISFVIGAVIAQQGAWTLRYFGAEFFTVDFAGILLLREVGVLLTAIMVAGRTGSAMTAEIGSMRMREEIDAMRVIGLNPVGVLVLPRLIALVISLPILTFVADIASLAGAALLLNFYSDIPFDAFIVKLRAAIDLSTVFAGLIKAPFMAAVIGIMAAVEGMKVEGSAESLGRRVTAAVVKAIFFVIVIDGFFAVYYAQIDY
jgi:phospholipid/cholesterol/gamma-HCH transport system permease protein